MRCGFRQYLEIWQRNRERVVGWAKPEITGYHQAVATTWQTSVNQLTEAGRHLLERLAFLAPDPVPIFLLDLAIPGVEAGDQADALLDLAAVSLVTRDAEGEHFSVHPLVQDVTRRSLDAATSCRRIAEALGWVDAAFDGDPGDVRAGHRLDPLSPHVQSVTHHADSAGIVEPTAMLMNQLGILFHCKSLYVQAEPMIRRALAIGETSFGPDHPAVATRLSNLAQLLQATGRLAEAERIFRCALAIDEASLGSDHPAVATRLSNLAQLLQDTNRLAEAEQLMGRALAIDEASFGPDHSKVASDLNNFAALLHRTSRSADAEPLYRRALAIHEARLGPDHTELAVDLDNLAELLQDTKRLAEAEPLVRRALAIDVASFGPDHPTVATRLNDLAGLLVAANRLTEAEPLLRRQVIILTDFERKSGHPHRYRDAAVHNYTRLLAAMRKSEAEIKAAIAALTGEGGK